MKVAGNVPSFLASVTAAGDDSPKSDPKKRFFDRYLFADYSGARSRVVQRKRIRLARATVDQEPSIYPKRLARDELVTEFVSALEEASERGHRVCFGQDHQYGIPFDLAAELSLDQLPWRAGLAALVEGTFGSDAPPLDHPSSFAKALNSWLVARGGTEYFYSATKSVYYGVSRNSPRPDSSATYRLTERCRPESGIGRPMPFNRVGDNGSVGGQTICGLLAIHSLLKTCEEKGIRVAVWPFDGLDIGASSYQRHHVMIEVYPTSMRDPKVGQSDDNDALAAAKAVRDCDLRGTLREKLDLGWLNEQERKIVAVEGWIFGHRQEIR